MDTQIGVVEMDRSNIVTLISVKHEKDAIGNHIPVETKRDVYCNIASVSGTEWMEAGRIGIVPQYKLTVFEYDYQGEEIAELNGKRYGIYRTYLGKNENLELYLQRIAGV